MEIVILLTGIILSLLYFNFLFSINRGLLKKKAKTDIATHNKFVSVIIPFRNETDNIIQNLQCISEQSFPKENYEVIYVNDSSDDDSLEKISLATKPENVHIVSIPDDFKQGKYKKRAILYALSIVKGDIIVSTDCDCWFGPEWLKTIINEFNHKGGFISGPVTFSHTGTIFEKLQVLEFSGLVLSGAGLIGMGRPVICNGANIAYSRRAFDEVNGFIDPKGLASGDDELLMQKIARQTDYHIGFCMKKEAVVYTRANKTISEFYYQRKRWASKGLYYNDINLKLRLVSIYLFYLMIPCLFVFSFFVNYLFWGLLAMILGVKFVMEYLIIQKGENLLFAKNSLPYFIAAEIFQIPYIIIAGIAGAAGNFKWKERKIKR